MRATVNPARAVAGIQAKTAYMISNAVKSGLVFNVAAVKDARRGWFIFTQTGNDLSMPPK
jgi:hypothetical protein